VKDRDSASIACRLRERIYARNKDRTGGATWHGSSTRLELEEGVATESSPRAVAWHVLDPQNQIDAISLCLPKATVLRIN